MSWTHYFQHKMIVREQGEGLFFCFKKPSQVNNLFDLVMFGMLVWSTGLAPNPLISSISEILKDKKTSR